MERGFTLAFAMGAIGALIAFTPTLLVRRRPTSVGAPVAQGAQG